MLQPLQPPLQSARYVPEVRAVSRLRPGSKYARQAAYDATWRPRKPDWPIPPIGPEPFGDSLTEMLDVNFRVTAGSDAPKTFIVHCRVCHRFWFVDLHDPLRMVQMMGHMADHHIPLRAMC